MNFDDMTEACDTARGLLLCAVLGGSLWGLAIIGLADLAITWVASW